MIVKQSNNASSTTTYVTKPIGRWFQGTFKVASKMYQDDPSIPP